MLIISMKKTQWRCEVLKDEQARKRATEELLDAVIAKIVREGGKPVGQPVIRVSEIERDDSHEVFGLCAAEMPTGGKN